MMQRPAGIPGESGCYLFRDRGSKVVYVGKAKNLNSRLGSYFQKTDALSAKTQALMSVATSVDWIVTANEVDALILENELIKQHQPRFNVRLKDDKSYPYLAIDERLEFPQPFITRSSRLKGVRYFGPFGHVKALRAMLDQVLHVAPLRSCSQNKYRAHERTGRPCLLYDIGKCSGPCVGAISPEEYKFLVAKFAKFFDGDVASLQEQLTHEMNAAAERRNYEAAARARDGLQALEVAAQEQHVVLDTTSDLDLLTVVRDGLRSVVVCFHVRMGRIVGRDARLFDVSSESEDSEIVELFAVEHYSGGSQIPSTVLTTLESSTSVTIQELLARLSGRQVRVQAPRGDSQRALVVMAARDGEALLRRDGLRRQADHNVRSQALIELGEALGLQSPPYRIECFDMSHLQGTNYVGSMVVAVDGLAAKKEYRHFNVKSVLGNDDAGAMREVLGRRLKYWDTDDAKFPNCDLLVVDGGLPQLSAALDAVAQAGLLGQVELVALAKREELLYRPGSSVPIRLDRGSEALYLLQRLRDEAHRFAITFHRSKRGSSMVASALDGVPGLGPVRRQALLANFGSMKRIRSATKDELMTGGGLSEKVASKLYDHLHQSISPRLEKGSSPDE